MKAITKIFFITLVIYSESIYGQRMESMVDFIRISENQINQDILLESDCKRVSEISIQTFLIKSDNQDSTVISKAILLDQKIEKGLQTITINYTLGNSNTLLNLDFESILKAYNLIPPGTYHTYLKGIGDSVIKFVHIVDSMLDINCNIQKTLFSSLEKEINKHSPEVALERISKAKGLSTKCGSEGLGFRVDFYYGIWFLGRYYIQTFDKLKLQLEQEKQRKANQLKGISNSSIENTESLRTKFKKLSDLNKEENNLKGDITLSNNWSTQQDPNSFQDQNFYELGGQASTNIVGIPVRFEGFFTSQDKNRKIKSSYIRFHYNIEEAKSKMADLLSGFNRQVDQTKSQSEGMTAVYGNYVRTLNGQKGKIQNEIRNQLMFSLKEEMSELDTVKIKNMLLDRILSDSTLHDDSKKLKAKQDSVMILYRKLQSKYEEAELLRAKAERYSNVLTQYQKQNYFDSALNHNNFKNIKEYETLSYKEMCKKASHVLPEGNLKRLTNGITHFDIGVLNTYTSKYTMAGQQLKGLSTGYDVGFAKTKVTFGRTEYIGRDGNIDRYSCYGIGLESKPILEQKIILDYFGYSPSRRMLKSDKPFFENLNTSYPSFTNPVHVVSISQEGEILKSILLQSSIATSMKQGEGQNIRNLTNFNLAYAISTDIMIPKSTITLNSGFEHIGKDFENNTLPFAMTGTDMWNVKAKGVFFKNFLQGSVEFYQLIQNNLSTLSKQSRWGFDVRTKSKRYPNVQASYKPFATIRTFSDTLNIVQRPLVGAVWMLRGNYMYKHEGKMWRVDVIYNRATNTLDTVDYQNQTKQISLSYQTKRRQVLLQLASINAKSSNPDYLPIGFRNQSYQSIISTTMPISTGIQTALAFDLSFNRQMLFNSGITCSSTYKMKKIPLQYRFGLRYNRYKLEETNNWQPRIACNIDISYTFNYSLHDK